MTDPTEHIRNAYYVKLGRGGKWFKPSRAEGKIRIGWVELTCEDINEWREKVIREKIRLLRKEKRAPENESAVTRDLNALGKLVHSTSDDVWITFHASHLWWCRVGEFGIEHINDFSA